ncbi:hypothetical protein D5086_011710 [Populus alba]|uniref:Uncharacterized protein n=1 Tax=Populus alba TaxID=43335 RepID=A0ACC4CEK6_POPAL
MHISSDRRDGAAFEHLSQGMVLATAKGSEEAIIYPEFIASFSRSLQNDSCSLENSAIVMFGPSSQALGSEMPTRVAEVSSFLWKCLMAASEEWRGSQRPSLLTHYVNLRRKMEPKLSDNSMGNFLWLAAAKYTNKSKPGLKDLVGGG